MQAKIAASIIQKMRSLQEPINLEGIDVERKLRLIDRFFTFVSYFNSLKELGNASHMYDDSLRSFRDTIYRNFESYDHEKEIETLRKKQAEGSVKKEGEEEASAVIWPTLITRWLVERELPLGAQEGLLELKGSWHCVGVRRGCWNVPGGK